MRRTLALVLLALGASACSWPASGEPVYERVHGATLTLRIGIAGCSGTAVGPGTILSASHCVEPATKTLTANGETCEVWKQFHDGKDHVLLKVTGCRFKATARMGKAPRVGDSVFMWGSPSAFTDLLRFGRVAGYKNDAMPGMGRAQMIDINSSNGDSGSALFNEDGEVVAVLSIGTRFIRMAGAFPIQFTRKQWDEAL